MSDKPLLGEILVRDKLVDQETVDQALHLQVSGNRRLGHILVKMKAIDEDQLADVLAAQLGIEISHIVDCSTVSAKKELPRYLCRQYGVLPLQVTKNNVLQVAMANPSDQEAIADIEHYTGRLVEPVLARHSDVDRAISRCIPLSINDFFSPQANTIMTRAVAATALVFAIGLGMYTYDYIKKSHQGTVSVTASMTLYNNHDLTVAVSNEGRYSLQGHGAFADGLYKAEFSSLSNLEAFIEKREGDLSEKQRSWLDWALNKIDKQQGKELVAQN